jgi:hypothetical protein
MLSVVIATHESERALVRTLAALVAGAAAGAVREVIVTDAHSTDATAEVADLAGCRIVISGETLATRLKAATADALGSWLMFLRPGVVLDATWIGDTARFIEQEERQDAACSRAAVFRPAAPASASRPLLLEALSLLRAALGGRPRPDQGLLISRHLYDRIGGHRENVADAETDLLRRLGRRRIVMLRSAAVMNR